MIPQLHELLGPSPFVSHWYVDKSKEGHMGFLCVSVGPESLAVSNGPASFLYTEASWTNCCENYLSIRAFVCLD